MNELFEKFPQLIKSLLLKIEELDQGQSNPKIKQARDKLLHQLHSAVDEISDLKNKAPVDSENPMASLGIKSGGTEKN